MVSCLEGQTWDGGGADNNWTTSANWSPDGAPLNNGTAYLNFAGSVRLTSNVNVPYDIDTLSFTGGGFSIGGATLTVRDAIWNFSSVPQTINNPIVVPPVGNAWFASSGPLNFGGPITINSNLSIMCSQPVSIMGQISGSGTVFKEAADTLTLSAQNLYTGGTVIYNGQLVLANNSALWPDASLTLYGGGLQLLAGFSQSIRALNGNQGATVLLGQFAALTVGLGTNDSYFSGMIGTLPFVNNNRPTFTKTGKTTFDFAGAITNFGLVVIEDGVLRLEVDEPLDDRTELLLKYDGTLDLINYGETVAAVTLTNSASLVGCCPGGPGPFGGKLCCNLFNQNGGTMAATVINRGTYNFNPATPASTMSGTVTNLGVFNLNGDSLGGIVVNRGTFNYNAGTIAGRLVNYGVFNRGPFFNVIFGNGLASYAPLALVANQVFTFNGLEGLDNQSSFTLANSTLLGTGALMNNNLLSGFGTVGGSGGFINNGQLTINGGALSLDNTGRNDNWGNIDLAAGLQLRLSANGGGLNNFGTLNLNSGVVAGTAPLWNNAGGIVAGRGTITAPFTNTAGMVLLSSGTLNILTPFLNGGTIQLTAASANLAGGGIANSGTIQGWGTLANPLMNAGTVEAIGGTLTLSGPQANPPTGLLTALSGGKLLLSSGLPINGGIISLNAGTFDNNGWPLNNAGQISGFGVFRSGGLLNNGVITFSGGLSTINGNLTNQASRTVTVAYNPAIFTGTIVNNGTFKTTSTSVQFAGTFIQNGAFNSDPATNYFKDLFVGPNGYFTAGEGDVFVISGNFQNGSLQGGLWNTRQAELIFQGSATHTFSLAGGDSGAGYGSFSTNFAWKSIRLAAGESLTLQDGNGASGGALYTKGLVLEGGVSQITLINGNGLSIYYDPTAPENAYLRGGNYSLGGGGSIGPAILPAIRFTRIAPVTPSIVHLEGIGVPNEVHSVHASTNLRSWTAVASTIAGANGALSLNVTNSPAFPTRFYRLVYP